MSDDLTHLMKDRLEKWRKNLQFVKSAEPLKRPLLLKCRNVRRDHGDDLRDIEQKDEEAYAKQLQNNPIYRGYK